MTPYCSSHVLVSNDCFQYCQTALHPQEFSIRLLRVLKINFGTCYDFGDDVVPVMPKRIDEWHVEDFLTLANGGLLFLVFTDRIFAEEDEGALSMAVSLFQPLLSNHINSKPHLRHHCHYR